MKKKSDSPRQQMHVQGGVLPGRQPGESFNQMLARVIAIGQIQSGGPFDLEERTRLAKYLGVGPGDERLRVLELSLFRLLKLREIENGRELTSADLRKLSNLGVDLRKAAKPLESIVQRILKLPAPMCDLVQESIQDAVCSTAAIRSEAISLEDVATVVRGLVVAFEGRVGRPREWFARELTYQLGLTWRAVRGRSPNLDTTIIKHGSASSDYSGAFPQFVRAAFAIAPDTKGPGDGVLGEMLERFPRVTTRGKYSLSEEQLDKDWFKLCAAAKELTESSSPIL